MAKIDGVHIKEIVKIQYIKNKFGMKRFIQKLLLWWSYKKTKKNKKTIWEL
jgi:hypothetical protein